MLIERTYLSDDKRAYLDSYISDNRSIIRDAMLIFPGGGYSYCSEREAEPIATAFLSKGFNCFVLNYRTSDTDRYPDQLIDASRALIHIKDNADRYNINPERVFAVGFSAGGHLLGTLATVDTRPEAYEALGVPKKRLSLAGMILSYPVITAFAPTHGNSFVRLSGKQYEDLTEEEKKRLSVETHINENSPPAFLWHTAEDRAVPLDGTIAVAKKYLELKRPVSLRIYPYGPHGMSLANSQTSNSDPRAEDAIVARWVDEAAEWVANLRN